MQWWAWITVGAILLGSELTFVNAQFYLVFIGGAALTVGLLDLAGISAADWMQWLLFALLAAVSLIGFRGPRVLASAPQPAGVQRGARGRDRDSAADAAARGELPARAPRQFLERGERRPGHHHGRNARANRTRGRPDAGRRSGA